jgi:RNA polymerase subunit RPABC4/transcription elongation factor Spt4
MEQRIFHGKLTPDDLSRALFAEFNRGGLRTRQVKDRQEVIVQISSIDYPSSGGQTSLTIALRPVADGVAVSIGQQNWLGVAASLGQTVLSTILNPWNIIGRLDDLAQDVESLQLAERVWQVIENAARSAGATFELSERLRTLVCEYCHTANPVGSASCVACGGPLGKRQPRTCPKCGFVVRTEESFCPNCKQRL